MPDGAHWFPAVVISPQGLVLLVNACTKPVCAPFKQWVAEVIETVQREGSYSLEQAEVQPAGPRAPVAHAMPEQVADAIVRLEAHNLQVDQELAVAQRESLALQREAVAAQRAVLAAREAIAEAMGRIADRLDVLAPDRPAREKGELREPLDVIAARTGLSVRRVNECLRLLRKHACIRSRGGAQDGAPVYVLHQP
ncbi:Bro-N domain-containing protein [Streptomyces anandii]|uniref:Bro-N domain-containing protein n=1 Tax=Streptomyces anandii TaxID=285454 RepID=UPI0019A6129B|nr:Bro-N domain-containing protein [Streptomyces anandii]GGX93623.1 hypothetical protein GCM10010510_43650 [Streptomyces anandii JCM 4720]